jgi:hypothetical protein
LKITSTGKDGTTEREVPEAVFTFKEGDMWIATWRHFYIVTQGPTEKEAYERLVRTLGEHCIWDGIANRQPFARSLRPTAEQIAEWERKHNEQHELK